LAGRLSNAAARLNRGSELVILTGESERTLDFISMALAARAAGTTAGALERPRNIIKLRHDRWAKGLREILDRAENSIVLINRFCASDIAHLTTAHELFDQFLRARGAILATMTAENMETIENKHRNRSWFQVKVPELSRRRADAVLIWEQLARDGMANDILPAGLTKILNHDWTGGLDELIAVIDSARILSARSSRKLVEESVLSTLLRAPTKAQRYLMLSECLEAGGLYQQATEQGLDTVLRMISALLIAKAMAESQGNQRRAANLLRIPGSTFVSRIRAVCAEYDVCRHWI